MKHNFNRKLLAIILSLALLMNSGAAAFAADGGINGIATSTTADCSCPTVDSGVVHGAGCTLNEEKPEQSDCICPRVDSGDVTHGEGCPLYEKLVPEQADAVKNVLALIGALPTMDELAAQDTEGAGFADYLAKLRLDTAAARTAYNALTDEEKAELDPAVLAKLTELEGVLAAMPVLMSDAPVTTWADLHTAIGNAPTNGTQTTINLSGTFNSSELLGPIYIENNKNIVIDGGKIEGSGNQLFVLNDPSQLTLKNFHVDGQKKPTSAPTIIKNNSKLTIADGCVFENIALIDNDRSGIINNEAGGNCTVNGGIFRNNTSTYDDKDSGFGSVGIYNQGILTITGGTFSNNRHNGNGRGAAIYNISSAKCYISGGTFDSSNVAKSNNAGIFHSSQTASATGEMHLSGDPAINCPLFLDAGTADKFIYLDGALTGNVTLKPANYEENYVLVEAASGYTLTTKDYLHINLLQPADSTWYTKLKDDGTAIVATKSAGERLATVYLAPANGNDTNNGKTASTAIKTFGKAKQLLANGGKIILVPPVTISGDELWELPNGVFGGATVTDDGTVIITVSNGGSLNLGDVTIEGIDRIKVESGGSVTIGDATVIKPESGGTTDIVVDGGGTLNIGKDTNLTNIDKIYTVGGGTVNDNGNAAAGSKTDATTTPPVVTDTPPAAAPAITITIDGGAEVGGTSLQTAIDTAKGAGAYSSVLKLTITKGEVTTADWTWFKGGTKKIPVLTALTDFTVAAAVTAVAPIPSNISGDPIFPKSIATVTIPQSIKISQFAFNGCIALKTVDIPKATSIGDYAFSDCTALLSASFPLVASIDAGVFSGCTTLASVDIPKATSIGTYAFYKCTALTTASFPVATSIGVSTFSECTALATLKLGATPPTTVDTNAFYNCPTDRSLKFVGTDGSTELTGDTLTTAQTNYKAAEDDDPTNDLWWGWKVREPVVESKITIKINDAPTEHGGASLSDAIDTAKGADGAYSSITKLTITKGEVTAADWTWFAGGTPGTSTPVLTKLTDFTIDASIVDGKVAGIPNGYVNKPIFPTTIVAVTIPQTIAIGTHAFFGCSKLTTATIPNATNIGDQAFSFCLAIDNISFQNVTSIGQDAFTGCVKLKTASFPAATTAGRGAFSGCKALTSADFLIMASVAEDMFFECYALKDVSFPDATSIGKNAFNNCTKALKTVSFPKVTSIRENAFANSSLTTASFPKATSIGAYAFYRCSSFAELRLGATVPTTVGTDAFDSCLKTTLTLVDESDNALTDTALATAQTNYDNVTADGNTAADDLWYGWRVRPIIAVTGVSLNKPTLALEVDKTETLTATVAPANAANTAVTWSSSKASVATVDANGLVTAVAAGIATITVTTADGSKTATCAVTVSVPKITIKINGIATEHGGETLKAAVDTARGAEAYSSVLKLTITGGEVTTADWEWFMNGTRSCLLTALTHFTIENVVNVVDIPDGTEYNTTFPSLITNVSIPQAIKIGNYAFTDCDKLADIYFPEATAIGKASFDGCSKLKTASFPKVISIGSSAFVLCEILESASFPLVQNIGMNSLACEKLATLTLGATPPSVVASSFAYDPAGKILKLVGTNGNALAEDTNPKLSVVAAKYDEVVPPDIGTATDGLWWGWKVREAVATPEAEWTPTGGVKATGTFAKALTAMNGGGSITLLDNVTLTATANIKTAVTLDLGGKTLDANTGYSVIAVESGGKLTLKGTGGGTLTVATGNGRPLTINNGGTAIVDGGTITNESNGNAIVNNGTLTINSGTNISSDKNSAILNTGTLTINGGTMTSKSSSSVSNAAGATLEITGGTIETKANGYNAVSNSSILSLGGTPTLTVPTGSIHIGQIGDNSATLSAKVGSTPYSGVAIRVSYSNIGEGLVLVSDVTNAPQAALFTLSVSPSHITSKYDDGTKTIQSVYNSYNINYYDEGTQNYSGSSTDSLPSTHTYNTATTLVDGVRDGYTFSGWFTDSACTEANKIAVLGAKAYATQISLYAKWTQNTPIESKITIKINDVAAEHGGTSLQAAVTAALNGANISTIKKLTITKGEVTAADWTWFKGGSSINSTPVLDSLTHFTIDASIVDGKVANIPNGAVVNSTNHTIFPDSIVAVSIPQAITIGEYSFTFRPKLVTVNLPKATSIGKSAFQSCTKLTSISLPAATSIGEAAFQFCTALTSVSMPNVSNIPDNAFNFGMALATLELGRTPPTVTNVNAFSSCLKTKLTLVDANGSPLTGNDLTTAQENYDKVADGISGSTATDGKWYGWTLKSDTPTFAPINGGVSFEDGNIYANGNALTVIKAIRSTNIYYTNDPNKTPIDLSTVDDPMDTTGSSQNGYKLSWQENNRGKGPTLFGGSKTATVGDVKLNLLSGELVMVCGSGGSMDGAPSNAKVGGITINIGEGMWFNAGVYAVGDNCNVTGNVVVNVTGGMVGTLWGYSGSGSVIGTVSTTITGGKFNQIRVPSLTIGGGIMMIAPEPRGIIIKCGTETRGVEKFAIADNLVNDVNVTLASGYTGGTIATGAVESDVAKIKLVGAGAVGATAKLVGTDIVVTVTPVSPEAEWTPTGGVKASGTLVDGFAALKTTGGTIKLVDNITKTENFDGIFISIDGSYTKPITFDLAGKKLAYTGGDKSTALIAVYSNAGLLTITDSSVGKNGGISMVNGFVVYVDHTANLALTGGSYAVTGKIDGKPVSGAIAATGSATEAVNIAALKAICSQGFGFSPNTISYDGATFMATTATNVSVVPDKPIAVTGVTLNKTALSLAAGKSEALTATLAPENASNKAVTWQTSNAAVATVTDGVVSALAAGTATITVTTTDGGKTATCAVTVTAATSKPAAGGKLEAPLTQDKVDDVFGEGNATLDGTTTPPTIKLEKDITPEKPIEIETDVKIDLGGNTITGKPGETPIMVGGGDKVTIDGRGTIAGGDSTTGTGGNGITGGTGSDITIGKDVIVSGGDGTNGGDGINSGGAVTDNGKTEGGNGSAGNGGDGVDTSGGNGNVVIGGGGTASGGDSTGGNGNGGNGITGGAGDIIINGGGTASGGNGNGSGNGGDGSTSTGDGDITNGGSSTGGNGGNAGGNGGNGTSTDAGNTVISGGGSSTGGNGGSGATGGKGGDGADSGTIDIANGGTANGGNGGTGTGTGGNGGDGSNSSGKGDIDGSANGGNGGSGGTTGGIGGNGAASGSGGNAGDINIGGKTEGGDGGSGGTSGGAGGNGTATGGDINVAGGGSSTGGNGGSSSTGGGNGGNGTSTDGNDNTVINGDATGGNGGNGNGNGSGGNGGNGASQGGGTVGGGGTANGGNGGNGAGTGSGGTGGAGVGGGASAGGGLTTTGGANGIKPTTNVDDSKSGTTVTVPDESKLADAALTADEKEDKDITEISVTLSIEKKNNQPDKVEVDKVLSSELADTIGAFFDITLDKIITKAGGAQPSTKVTDASEEIQITITIPINMRGGSNYVVIRVHNGVGASLPTSQTGNDLTFSTDKFSTYAIAYTPSGTTPPPTSNTSSGSSGGGTGNEETFWKNTSETIGDAKKGDVIRVNARDYDRLPAEIMDTIRKNGITLIIDWNNGETVTIPAGKAPKAEAGRVFYPLSLLAELYKDVKFVDTPSVIKPQGANPETGGPGYIEYADGKTSIVKGKVVQATAAPQAENATNANSANDEDASNGAVAQKVTTPPTAGFVGDAYVGANTATKQATSGNNSIALILAAVAVAGGVWLWKRKQNRNI